MAPPFRRSKDGLEEQARLRCVLLQAQHPSVPDSAFAGTRTHSPCGRRAAPSISLTTHTHTHAPKHTPQFATNHLGHFLMARLLMEPLAESGRRSGQPARVVVTSSIGHMLYPKSDIPLASLHEPKGYSPFLWYGYSKLANVRIHRHRCGAPRRRRRPPAQRSIGGTPTAALPCRRRRRRRS
jgi:hypothetical protein